MASATSRGPSPHLPAQDHESNGDTDESWQYLDFDYGSASSGPASIGFLSSPGSGSLNSYAVVGNLSTPSPLSASPNLPLAGDLDQPGFFIQPGSNTLPHYSSHVGMSHSRAQSADSLRTGDVSTGWAQEVPFMTPQQYLFTDGTFGNLSSQDINDLTPLLDTYQPQALSDQDQNIRLGGSQTALSDAQLSDQSILFDLQLPPNTDSSWQADVAGYTDNAFVFEDPTASPVLDSSASSSPVPSSSRSEKSVTSPARMHKVRSGKVEKRQARSEPLDNFVVVTPNSISAQSGRPNPYECFEHLRATQKGRKGPLANATKQSALQVRRLGACFCCHSRKVKCDKERPCKNCKKLAMVVPQVICWQFQDFLTILFPGVIRSHLKKEEVTRFISQNVEDFTIGGNEQPCEVELYSGPTFTSTLILKAKFFTAKTSDVLQHWHMMAGQDQVELQTNCSVPIGAELQQHAERDDLKKRTKAYIQQITKEPGFAAQVTDSLRSTSLPRKILGIVQTYAQQTDSTMVRRALSIYGMHYVLTRHLCLTRSSIYALQLSGLVPQDVPWLTPRVLARQVKSLIDDLMQREMQHLFDLFSKSLKPKHRAGWAPCLAAFLVLCLFMEAVETATDNFVVTENEVNLRKGENPRFKRSYALDMCKEVENMPFKQFAYQFHNIYQTHSKDANTKSFNPLFDNSFAELGELDGPAKELVLSLRELFHGTVWQDMQFLADDELVISREEHPFPRDPSLVYTGRLIAKFLLSFTDENAIFGSRV